jgi:hypothetical protein
MPRNLAVTHGAGYTRRLYGTPRVFPQTPGARYPNSGRERGTLPFSLVRCRGTSLCEGAAGRTDSPVGLRMQPLNERLFPSSLEYRREPRHSRGGAHRVRDRRVIVTRHCRSQKRLPILGGLPATWTLPDVGLDRPGRPVAGLTAHNQIPAGLVQRPL